MPSFAKKGQGRPVDATTPAKPSSPGKSLTATVPADLHERMMVLKARKRIKVKTLVEQAIRTESERTIAEYEDA